MSRSGQSVFGYRVMIFILFIGILFVTMVAYYLNNNNAAPESSDEVVYVVVTPTTDVLSTETPQTLLEQAQSELDDLKILRLLFGEEATYQFSDTDGVTEAKWVPAVDSLGPFPANGARPYLTRILQLGPQHKNQPERVLVFTQSAPFPALSVECQMVIGLAELRFEGGEWVSSFWQPALQPEDGLCGVPGIEAVLFGEEEPGFVFHQVYEQKGESVKVDEFYKPSADGYGMVFSLETYHDNGGVCPPSCYSTLAAYEWLPAESDGLYDLQVTIRGTQLVEGQVVVVNESPLYVFQDGFYQLWEPEEEIITE